MRWLTILLITVTIQACSTVGGAVSGAGEDLSRAGQYIKNVGK